MRNKLKKILIEKFSSNKLAHLYLIEPTLIDSSDQVLKFTKEVLQQFIDSSKYPKKLTNHPDILEFTTENKSYNMDDLKLISDFVKYKSIELPQKFLIITQLEKLSELHLNKLLKTFEEPPVPLCIFLLNPRKTNILPTVVSRTIKLRLPITAESPNFDIVELIKEDITFINFTEKVVKEKISTEDLSSEILNYAALFNSEGNRFDNSFSFSSILLV